MLRLDFQQLDKQSVSSVQVLRFKYFKKLFASLLMRCCQLADKSLQKEAEGRLKIWSS